MASMPQVSSRFGRLSKVTTCIDSEKPSGCRWLPLSNRGRSERCPLLRTSSSLSANGTTSSARLCRITVPGLTVLVVPWDCPEGPSFHNDGRERQRRDRREWQEQEGEETPHTRTLWQGSAGPCETRHDRPGLPRHPAGRLGRDDP